MNLSAILNEIGKLFTRDLFTLGNSPISILTLAKLIVTFVVILLFCRFLRLFLKNQLLVRLRIDEGNRTAIATIISYSLGTLVFLISVQAIGFNLAALAVVAGGLGVGIGFGLQNITNNFISGLTLLLERNLKVGDFIEFEGLEGYIKEVSLRSTVIRTREGGDVVVPNSKLVDNSVLNWSHDSYVARVDIPVGVAYSSDPVVVTEALLKAAYSEPAVQTDPAPRVMFVNFGDSALEFELWVWVNRIDLEPYIRSSLNFTIEYNLRQQDIVVPFPQRDLWLKNPEVLQPSYWEERQRDRPQLTSRPLSLRQLLHEISYFETFNDLQLRQLIEIGYRKRLRSGEVLFRENEPGDAFYIILSGSVEVVVEALNKYLTTLNSGQFFGEISLMLGIPRTATVRAKEETLLFAIDRRRFKKLLHEHPELYEAIVAGLESHREELVQRQQELRKLGLVDRDEDDKNPVAWVRKRLKNLFGS